MKTTDPYDALLAHLADLQEKAETWYCTMSSSFLSEEEQAAVMRTYPPSDVIVYDGGFPGSEKKKIFFLPEAGSFDRDIVCLGARIDQRFRRIEHRDVMGAVMHLQVDRHSFGDFWIEGDMVYLYTTAGMSEFFIDNLTRINQLSVKFSVLSDHPVRQFEQKEIHVVIASLRMDAVIAGLAHCSRQEAKEMIHLGNVQLNHVVLAEVDKLCNNADTISIRGKGRFHYSGASRKTQSGRIAACFLQDI